MSDEVAGTRDPASDAGQRRPSTRHTLPIIGVLVAGRGSNLRAILEAIDRGELRAQVGIVISSKPDAPALGIATERGIPTRTLRLRDFASRADLGAALVEALRARKVELVALAGYNLIFDPCVIRAFPNRILNIHPSLLPAFAGGMAPKPQADALEAGVKISGCTVHVVTDAVDAGPIIAQAAVPVLEGDTVEALSARILAEEHRLFPYAIGLMLSDRVHIKGGTAHIAGAATTLPMDI
jgi:phosphoribosylglycinamide formyltransferase 1